MSEFADLVQKRLAATAMTPSALARRTGYSAAHVFNVLHGRRAPAIEFAAAVIRALGISAAEHERWMACAARDSGFRKDSV